MEQESILGTAVENIATGTRKGQNKRGRSNQMIPCPKCQKLCRGQIGLETHDDWQHNEEKRAKRMKAARRVGKARILANRGMIVPPKLTPKGKRGSPSSTRAYKNNWYKKNKAKVANARRKRIEDSMELSTNGVQPLQRAANTGPGPRVLQFWKELEAVEQALAYVQAR